MATAVQQKQELFKAIWATAEDLRNSVDGWDFKSYVLGILFYRFISENITNYINAMQRAAGDPDFDYADFPAEEAEGAKADLVREKGFFILPSQLFCNVRRRAKSDPNLNVILDNIFKAIEASAIGTESEPDLKGLFADIDVNSNKLGGTVEKRNEQLTKILNNIGGIDLKGEYAETDTDVDDQWSEFVRQSRQREIDTIIEEENLNRDKALDFVRQAFRNGEIRESGTAIAGILPPMGLFGNAGIRRAEKKANVIRRLKDFFDRFYDISGGNF